MHFDLAQKDNQTFGTKTRHSVTVVQNTMQTVMT